MSLDTELEIEESTAYKVHLSNFDGPLDLLLHLIKESKMSIEDVKLADITEQYLDYMKELDTIDMDSATEFIIIASTLIEIKSKKLLPIEAENAEEDIVDEEAILKQRLKEHELFKQVMQDLGQIENVNKMYKQPDKSANNVRIILKDMQLENLLDAFTNMMTRFKRSEENQEPRKIQKDRFTVAEKIIAIKNAVQEKKVIKFSDMFTEKDLTKSEVLNIFLALLELLKLQFVKVKQTELFGEIDIYENQDKKDKEQVSE